MNRVKKKPYVEAAESNGRADAVVSQEAWEKHKQRNDSVIVDTFHGQLKSTLVCPDCDKISITFEPFMTVSLPLPVKETEAYELTFFKYASSASVPIKYSLKCSSHENVASVKERLFSLIGVPPNRQLFGAIGDHRLHRFLPTGRTLSSSKEFSLVVFESPGHFDNSRVLKLQFVHRVVLESDSDEAHASTTKRKKKRAVETELFGRPFLRWVSRKYTTGNQLYEMAWAYLQPLILQEANKIPVTPVAEKNGEAGKEAESDVVAKESASTKKMAKKKRAKKKNSDDEDYDTLEWPPEGVGRVDWEKWKDKLPFRLVYLTMTTSRCGKCSYISGCSGCNVPFSDDRVKWRDVRTVTIGIEWTYPRSVTKFYNSKEAKRVRLHKSVKQNRKKVKNTTLGIESCLKQFCKPEVLGKQDMWYCSSCKEHKQATKALELWHLPKILIVQLKRFQYSKHYREKLNTFCDFPLSNFDLSPYVLSGQKNLQYNLFGVSNHSGGLRGGHYTAYAKNFKDGKWYHFNDSNVHPTKAESVKSSAAYVLFYERTGEDQSAPKKTSKDKTKTKKKKSKAKN
eukprot:TRINITY_DN4691_c0_g1_i1.p1 TRINITY_DN4691_c0_g1~~TRINITY_DN4691_c0_g1_i1.p1  ORF type:complete len:646 (+),score=94.46 TRINITY_DN4691_c0_g1_i1:236-1939(+)